LKGSPVKYRFLPVSYTLRVFRADPFILPAAVWTLFVIMAWMLAERMGINILRAYLGFVLPLSAGFLGAYSILDDQALELAFSAPRPAGLTLTERLGLILAIHGILALAYQLVMPLLGVDAGFLGGPLLRQLTWFVPTLAMASLGAAASLLFANCLGGGLAAGGMWIVQLILRGWFIYGPYRRYFLLFAGVMAPREPFLPLNQLVLTGVSIGWLLLAIRLLKKQERYI
jgi:hypothetical protein